MATEYKRKCAQSHSLRCLKCRLHTILWCLQKIPSSSTRFISARRLDVRDMSFICIRCMCEITHFDVTFINQSCYTLVSLRIWGWAGAHHTWPRHGRLDSTDAGCLLRPDRILSEFFPVLQAIHSPRRPFCAGRNLTWGSADGCCPFSSAHVPLRLVCGRWIGPIRRRPAAHVPSPALIPKRLQQHEAHSQGSLAPTLLRATRTRLHRHTQTQTQI